MEYDIGDFCPICKKGCRKGECAFYVLETFSTKEKEYEIYHCGISRWLEYQLKNLFFFDKKDKSYLYNYSCSVGERGFETKVKDA